MSGDPSLQPSFSETVHNHSLANLFNHSQILTNQLCFQIHNLLKTDVNQITMLSPQIAATFTILKSANDVCTNYLKSLRFDEEIYSFISHELGFTGINTPLEVIKKRIDNGGDVLQQTGHLNKFQQISHYSWYLRNNILFLLSPKNLFKNKIDLFDIFRFSEVEVIMPDYEEEEAIYTLAKPAYVTGLLVLEALRNARKATVLNGLGVSPEIGVFPERRIACYISKIEEHLHFSIYDNGIGLSDKVAGWSDRDVSSTSMGQSIYRHFGVNYTLKSVEGDSDFKTVCKFAIPLA